MSDTRVLGGLVAKRGELADQVEQSRREMQRLAEELSHLEATIRLFDPDYDVVAVQSKGPRHRQQWFAVGECQRLVLEALRDALEPLSARAVMQLVAARKALPEHPEVRAGVQKTVQAQDDAGGFRGLGDKVDHLLYLVLGDHDCGPGAQQAPMTPATARIRGARGTG